MSGVSLAAALAPTVVAAASLSPQADGAALVGAVVTVGALMSLAFIHKVTAARLLRQKGEIRLAEAQTRVWAFRGARFVPYCRVAKLYKGEPLSTTLMMPP